MTKKLTREEFIDKYKQRFPNSTYDFSKFEYENSHKQSIVICPKHGEFLMNTCCLLSGTGCPKCGGTKKMTTEEFIEQANLVHHNYFTYDKVEYVNNFTKVIITCPIHGDFEQKPNVHLEGHTCPQCRKEGIKHEITLREQVNASTKKLTQEDFIRRATKLFPNYDFSKSLYVKSGIKIIVTCKEHGDFEITPNHLFGNRGCPYCSKNKKMNTEDFIKKYRERFPLSTLDFSESEYRGTHVPIKVKCHEHEKVEEFWNEPSNLLSGQGCPFCSKSKLENEVSTLLYKNNIEYVEQKKFDWLGMKRLDFYLPQKNIAIECQGEQHFKEYEFFGGKEAFEKQLERDAEKKRLCEENNIKLLYFTHVDVNDEEMIKDTDTLLSKINE
jgi:very-short-patch-repair endonuclease